MVTLTAKEKRTTDDRGGLLRSNFPLYRLVVLIASLALAFLLGYAFGQGIANRDYLNFNYEQTVKDICRKSISSECRTARGKLPDYPAKNPTQNSFNK